MPNHLLQKHNPITHYNMTAQHCIQLHCLLNALICSLSRSIGYKSCFSHSYSISIYLTSHLSLSYIDFSVSYSTFCFRVVNKVNKYFQPDAVVCQCGVDGLAGDPMNSFNLTQFGLAASVHCITSLEKPLLLLGGGE